MKTHRYVPPLAGKLYQESSLREAPPRNRI